MKNTNKEKILNLLKQLGLTNEQSQVYLEMLQNKDISVSKIAKTFNLGRTKTYRIIDELKDFGLINEIRKANGTKYTAKNYKSLDSLIEMRQAEITNMKNSLNSLKDLLTLSEQEKVKSGITSYNGLDGLKQVIWNTTKANGILKVFEAKRLNIFMDYGFAENVRMEYLRNKIRTKDLSNETHIESWSNITEFIDEFAECRYISPNELSMTFEIYIYNDIITLINYTDKSDIFCIEIKNIALKMIIENLFDFVWNRAEIMEIVGDGGEMKIKQN